MDLRKSLSQKSITVIKRRARPKQSSSLSIDEFPLRLPLVFFDIFILQFAESFWRYFTRMGFFPFFQNIFMYSNIDKICKSAIVKALA